MQRRLRWSGRLGWLGWLGSWWWRSIQLRVVASTVVLTAVAVVVIGAVLLVQTRGALLDHRREITVAEASEEVADAEARLGSASGADVNLSGQRTDLVEPIIELGLSRGFWVVLVGPLGEHGGRIAGGGAEWTPGLDTTSVPASLEDHFQRTDVGQAWTYTTIRLESSVDDPIAETDSAGSTMPGLVVGTQVSLPADGGTYTLYFLVPLTQEQDTLSLLTRGLILAGAVLVLVVGAASWFVARRVVTPIRLARQTAERLAAGRLTERMRVNGEDDLARLAVSFNQMATSLQNQIGQLENLSRVQRRFTSDVSHELRTPLTTVQMASHVLHDARDTFDPVTARAAELLQTELDRFETLLVDLLEISRFDAGAAALEASDVDLGEVARQVADSYRPLAERSGVRIVVHADGPALAEADVRRIERIVRNLVANAIDHVGDSDRIDITVAAGHDAAAIAVRDHGLGLAPGETAMVFNRFWRSDPARNRSSGGTGLGLSIALEDAKLHGGWLQAWGRPRLGTNFRLTLPRHVHGELRQSPLPLVPEDVRDIARDLAGVPQTNLEDR
ncbi:MAG: MtrAB system histidine kinase MtrB [Nocardioides sp.]|uniref:MtrAB system histidine kinase MtrB n=1 Tax=Nocardioides sp. TaxID=35761 RepID=UPI0039E48A11